MRDKQRWRSVSKNHKIRLTLMCVLFLVALVDVIIQDLKGTFAYFDQFIKPIVLLLQFSSVRAQFTGIFYDMAKNIWYVILSIYIYVAVFALGGYCLFKLSMEGFIYYQMLILITTANFPDVMLPAYNEHRITFIFFLVYLLIGLYFLLNMLISIMFDNYKRFLVIRVVQRSRSRVQAISGYFDRVDVEKTKTLSMSQAKVFFQNIFDLDYSDAKDRVTFRKIMKQLDPDNQKIVYRDDVREFFESPNFL
jgi:two pore calcium channel protein, plant